MRYLMLIFMLIFASPAICKDPPASLENGRYVLASYHQNEVMVYLDVLSVINSKVKHTDSFKTVTTNFKDHTITKSLVRFRKEQNNTYSFCILYETVFDMKLHPIQVNKTPSAFIPVKQGSVSYELLLTEQAVERECDKALPNR